MPDLCPFPPVHSCTACARRPHAIHPLPTRPAGLSPPLLPPSATPYPPPTPALSPDWLPSAVLLVVGEAPGTTEDQTGHCFVGRSGQSLHRAYLEHFGLPNLLPIYLSNAIRCHAPHKPRASEITKCRLHLLTDIQTLLAHYPTATLYILCCGAYATRSLLNLPLKKAFRLQGSHPSPRLWPDLPASRIHIFSTFHPAFLFSGRSPSSSRAVFDHLTLLHSTLTGCHPTGSSPILSITDWTRPPSLPPDPPWSCPPAKPPKFAFGPHFLSFDIETYGILRGHSQTQFNPRKCEHWDHVHPSQMIVTASVAWYTSYDPPHLAGGVLLLSNPTHRAWLRRLLATAAQYPLPSFSTLAGGQNRQNPPESRPHPRPQWAILGSNIQFDIGMLRYCGYVESLPPFGASLADLQVLNYLQYDGRPESSLKALAHLFGISTYADQFRQYESPTDPDLWAYNQQDASSTLLAATEMIRRTVVAHGPSSPKLSPTSYSWFSEVIWLLLHMSERGLAFDPHALRLSNARHLTQMAKLSTLYQSRYNVPLHGKGSGTALIKFFNDAATQLGLLSDPRLQTTQETHRISTGVENIALLLETAESHSSISTRLRILSSYRDREKEVTTYFRPMLEGRPRGDHRPDPSSTLIGDFVFPTYYPVPTIGSDTDDTSGGTPQARFSAKGPAAQTFPPAITRCLRSRFPGGYLVSYDYCLHGDTDIFTVEGRRKIKDVVQHGTEGVLTCSLAGVLSFSRPSGYVEIKNQPLMRVTVESGTDSPKRFPRRRFAVLCTPNHKWLSWWGSFVKTESLRPGCRLAHVHLYDSAGAIGYPQFTVGLKGAGPTAHRVHKLVCTLKFEGRKVVAHHKSGDKQDWSWDNLAGLNNHSEHMVIHSTGNKNPNYGKRRGHDVACPVCGEVFYNYPRGRRRFCSRPCYFASRSNHRVVSISPAGNADVYCLRVLPHSTFVLGNGLVSSNSQMELRIPGLLSNDPLILSEYIRGIDRHTLTAIEILGDSIRSHPNWKKYRQAGKHINFAIQFRAAPETLCRTLRRLAGISWTVPEAAAAISSRHLKYARFTTWQNEQITEACRRLHLDVPLTGHGRTFRGSPDVIRSTYLNVILNLRIQAISALCLQSAQIELVKEIIRRGWRTSCPLNCHDSILLDCPPAELPLVLPVAERFLLHPPYFDSLCQSLGRPIPLEIERTIRCFGRSVFDIPPVLSYTETTPELPPG